MLCGRRHAANVIIISEIPETESATNYGNNPPTPISFVGQRLLFPTVVAALHHGEKLYTLAIVLALAMDDQVTFV